LRFPYGESGGLSAGAVNLELGLRPIHWTFSSLDSRAKSELEIEARVSPRLRSGAIVLMHDCLADANENLPLRYNPDRSAVLAFTPILARILKEKALRPATLSQLIDSARKS